MDKLIDQLQKIHHYNVTEIGGEGEKVTKIENYRAINSKTNEADAIKEISTANLVQPKLTLPNSKAISCSSVCLGHLCCRPQHPQIYRPRHC